MKSVRLCFIACILLFFSQSFAADEGKPPYVATVSPEGIQKVEIVASEFYFDPKTIIVKVNVPVEITIRKEPSMAPHTFVLKAPEAGIDINESISMQPKVIKFTPKKVGKYAFYCDKTFLFKSHREMGMEGVLEVRE